MTLAPRPSDAELLELSRLRAIGKDVARVANARRDTITSIGRRDVGTPHPLITPGPNAIVSAIAGEKRTRPPKNDDPEHREQVALFDKIRALTDDSPVAELRQCYAIPNAAIRGKLTRIKMLAEGLQAGELDINLDIARGGFFGLRLEMKSKDGMLSVLQVSRIDEHRRNNFAAEVAYTADEAWRILTRYISLPPTVPFPSSLAQRIP